jgi:hypothetical protein
MPLQIRRGTTAQRLAITPLTGELIHDTTTGQLFVGNGTTAGGVTTTGISTEDAQDAAASLFTTGSHSGITFAYNDAAGRIDATVTVAATGPFDGDLTGSVFADDSTLLVDGTGGVLVGSLRTSGDVYITKNSYSGTFGNGLTYAQHHSTVDAVNFNFLRTRGTDIAPTAVANGDDIADLNFIGHDGTNRVSIGGITARVSGAVSLGIVPGELAFDTRNTAGVLAEKAVLTSDGIWKINQLGALSGTTINVVDNNTITLGDVRLSQDGLSTINTNASLILSANGTGSVDIESVRIQGNTISTTDSSGITVSQAATFSSNLTVDGTLTVGDSVVQNSVNRDYISTTLQTQGVNRVVNGVQNGTYVQLASSTSETYTTISYNSTIYKGCRATFKVSQANNVHISEVLLANSSAAVTIVNAQAAAATSGATNLISSITADYDSATGTIRLRPITSTSVTAGFNLLWTVSYQLFT